MEECGVEMSVEAVIEPEDDRDRKVYQIRHTIS
jgi:hypothetical protein